MAKQPWSSGPGEILQHGLSLLKRDTDVDRRLAMLSIDNAVELMIKTFLGLPKRVTGLTISRKRYDEFSESFPNLLDALHEFAGDRAAGINLGEIEWYHRLRNQLYHEGNGLTVERDKVRVYAELAKVLFKNLFGYEIEVEDDSNRIGDFIRAWSELESAVIQVWERQQLSDIDRSHFMMTPRRLAHQGLLKDSDWKEIENLRRVRNQWVNNSEDKPRLTADMIERLRMMVTTINAVPAANQQEN